MDQVTNKIIGAVFVDVPKKHHKNKKHHKKDENIDEKIKNSVETEKKEEICEKVENGKFHCSNNYWNVLDFD